MAHSLSNPPGRHHYTPVSIQSSYISQNSCCGGTMPLVRLQSCTRPGNQVQAVPLCSPWKEHINEHFTDLESKEQSYGGPDESKTFQCPDTRCGLSFDSVKDLRYHCH